MKTRRCYVDVPRRRRRGRHTDPGTGIFPLRLDWAFNFDSNKSCWYVGRWHRSCVAPSMLDSGDETVVMVVDGLRDGTPFLSPSLDILEVMYIKAELFWLGRCQNTFILICKTSQSSVWRGCRGSRDSDNIAKILFFSPTFIFCFPSDLWIYLFIKMTDRKIYFFG